MRKTFLQQKLLVLFFLTGLIGVKGWGQTTRAWSGTTSGAWLTTSNWTGSFAAGSTTSSNNDIASFNNTANTANAINMGTQSGNHYLGAINWGTSATTARTITNSSGTTAGILNFNGVTLNSIDNTILWNQSSATHVIQLTGSNGTTPQNLGISLNNATNNVIQITGTGGITISSNIIGNNPLTKRGIGTGALILSGTNSYSGLTTISEGRVNITTSTALGATSAGTEILSGAVLSLFPTVAFTTSENFTINGNGTTAAPGAIRNSALNNNINGIINVASASSITAGNTLSLGLGGVISGSANLTFGNTSVASGGTITLTAANTYTGLTTIVSGTLRLNRVGGTTIPSTNSLKVDAGGTLRIMTNQTIADLDLSGGGNLTVDAGVVLTITGTYTPGNGTIDCNSTGRINLTSNTPQSFPGVSMTTTNLGVLGIGNTSGASPSITIDKAITLNTSLNLTSGTLANANNITIATGGTIFRTDGTITGLAPTFGTTVNVSYNNVNSLTTGLEIPTSSTVLNNLTIGTNTVTLGSSPTVNGLLSLTSGTLAIGSNTLTLAGTVSRTSGFLRGGTTSNLTCSNTSALGSLFFDHSTDGTTNALNNFTKTGAGSVTIGNNTSATIAQLYIYGALDIQAGSLDVNQAVTGNHLVLLSNGTNLARVADLGATGSRLTQGANTKIVVERSTLSKRAWRLIAAPLTGNGLSLNTTVRAQWQNGRQLPSGAANSNLLGDSTAGFGTNIYGPSGTTGMDAERPGYSMLRWNYGLQNWRNVTNTTTEPMFGNGASGYTSTTDSTVLPTFLFARGDKTITTTTGFNSGRLRAVGKLLTGQQVFNYPGVGTGTKYVAIANPYAAPVDFESLMAGLSSNLKNPSGNTIYYYWDPSLNNFGGAFGGWVTVTRDNAGAYTQNSGTNGRYIQSGTAILIQPSDQLASSATFEESYKASGSNVSPATHGAGTNTIDKLVVQLRNADNAIGILDGTIAMFGSGYRKEFDKTEDGIKLEQNNESLCFINGSLKTGVESRGYIQQADTLQMNLVRTTTGTNYAFEFDPSNFDATVTSAKLVDKFLNSETPISLSAKTTIPFSVTATTGSNAADRFMVVFNGTGTLPNRGFSVTGEKLGTSKVKINWEAVNEFGVKQYELEHSTDGRTFSKINTQVGKNGNATNSYTYTDNNPANGVNYYRIKTTQNNDIERYSSIITINFKTSSSNNVSVYPNPVKGNVIGLQLQDLEKGVYSVRILSIEGKEVYKQQLQVTGSSLSTSINPSTRLAQGTYTLQLVGKNSSYTQKVIVE